MKNAFRRKVLCVVRSICKGEVLTYKDVARKAGNAKAARAVGSIMRANFDPTVPCHRVVKSTGALGSYNRGGEAEKERLLRNEGGL